MKDYLQQEPLDESLAAEIKEKSVLGQDPNEIPWKSHEKCIQVLKQGIPVIKYNYHNMKTRKVMLTLTHDNTRLTYTNQDAGSGLLCGLNKNKSASFPLKNFMGLVYGAQSATFIKHRDKCFEQY